MFTWHKRAYCGECNRDLGIPDWGNLDYIKVNTPVCPRCGAPRSCYRMETVRYVNDSKLFQPATWGNGHWETRNYTRNKQAHTCQTS